MIPFFSFRQPEMFNSNAYRRCWWVGNPPYGVLGNGKTAWAINCPRHDLEYKKYQRMHQKQRYQYAE
ncbi:MAG: hypothetical protein IKZ88_00190 [Neisseriaceae bacterium]|nr:hypothetical protein [Neisseriaceae bacterium]